MYALSHPVSRTLILTGSQTYTHTYADTPSLSHSLTRTMVPTCRDLKSENCLVSERHRIVVCDFGLSRRLLVRRTEAIDANALLDVVASVRRSATMSGGSSRHSSMSTQPSTELSTSLSTELSGISENESVPASTQDSVSSPDAEDPDPHRRSAFSGQRGPSTAKARRLVEVGAGATDADGDSAEPSSIQQKMAEGLSRVEETAMRRTSRAISGVVQRALSGQWRGREGHGGHVHGGGKGGGW